MDEPKLTFVPFFPLLHLFLPYSDEDYDSDEDSGDADGSTDFSLADSGYSGSNSPQLSHESRYSLSGSVLIYGGPICMYVYRSSSIVRC